MCPIRKRTGLTHEQVYNAFVEAVDDLVYIVDHDGRYAMLNKRALADCSLDSNKVIGKTPVEAFGDKVGGLLMRNNRQVLESGKPLYLQEWITLKGVSRCYSSSLNPIFDKDGETAAVIGISRDITDLKRMVEQLEIGSDNMHSLFQQRVHYEHLVKEIVRESITRHGIDEFLASVIAMLGEGLDVSRSYFFSYDHVRHTVTNTHEWVAKGIEPNKDMMQSLPTNLQPWWSNEMLAGRIICLEDTSSAPSPELVELLEGQGVKSILSIPIFVFGRPHGFVGFDQCDRNRHWDDIDVELLNSVCRIVAQKIERQRLEEEMLSSERLAAMGRLTQIFAHEINNPLQGIRLHLESIEQHLGEGSRKAFGFVMDGFQRISDIIARLSDASRSKAARSAVDMNGILKNACGLLSRQVDMKGISVRWFLNEKLPCVHGDERRLHQAVLNVLLNAFDSMGKGGELSISTSSDGKSVEVEVRDTGCGIDEADMPYLFEPFFTTKGKSGTGLGLFVSHSIIVDHSGSIEITSRKDEGTQVQIRLPVSRDRDPADKAIADKGR